MTAKPISDITWNAEIKYKIYNSAVSPSASMNIRKWTYPNDAINKTGLDE
jgi:hypothetical protein